MTLETLSQPGRLRKAGKVEMTSKAYQTLSQPGLTQALERWKGCLSVGPAGASLACQEPPMGGS
jgi:hypothetical protein